MLAGISDALDGLLARWLSQRTTLGQYLDPIADKLLLSTLFVVLTHVGLMPRYVTVLVFSRDLGILLIATLLFATGTLRDFRPSVFGKLNTLAQIRGFDRGVVREDFCVGAFDGGARWAFADDCGAGAAVRGAVCVDCDSENECAAAAAGGLVVGRDVGREPVPLLRWRCR